MRIVKEPEQRRNEILDTAEYFFCAKGYEQTTVNDILTKIGIAKGTFYYYFKSKEEVMDSIIARIVERDVKRAKEIAADQKLTPYEKFFRILTAQKDGGPSKEKLTEQLHLADNAQMHLKSIVESIVHLAPVLAGAVKEGIEQGEFETPYPLETVEILLISGQFLFDEGIFRWTQEEKNQKISAFIRLAETSLGARSGSFSDVARLIGG